MWTKYNITPRLRIVSGVVIYLYVVTHLMNHALGLVSLEFMEQARLVFVGFWRHPLMAWVVPTALLIHLILAFVAFFRQPSLSLFTIYEGIQYAFGFMIPLILLAHFVGTRIMYVEFGLKDTYAAYLLNNWSNQTTAISLSLMLIMAMVHGSIGMYHYLRFNAWFQKVLPFFIIFSVVLTVLALAGIISAEREVIFKVNLTPDWVEQVNTEANPQNVDRVSLFTTRADFAVNTYLILLALLVVSRWAFLAIKARRRHIQVAYSDGQQSYIYKGATILEASNLAQIPHAQICGGKGRCTTCRVYVIEGEGNLTDPNEDERNALKRIKASAHIRLACQAKLIGNCKVHPLFPADVSVVEGIGNQKQFFGDEVELVILFADIRGFTSFSEHRLPYDVVSLLNRYFKAAGIAIEQNQGYLDKFIGDGTMAIFGIDDGPQRGARNAIKAAQQLSREMNKINEQFKTDLEHPLQVGFGIHCGKVIIGKLGYKHTLHLTAIGDTVNISSRLESYTKEYQCQMIVSDRVARYSGYNFSQFEQRDISIRGRNQPLPIWVIPDITLVN